MMFARFNAALEPHGIERRYTRFFSSWRSAKMATVRTGWIIGINESDPRLTSAYVLIKKGGNNA